eukprot:CAMPEP_0119051800 /NCGR_PEP_ID=MMETSP1177-20130426/73296_1 /TAXON_ID=2985 /ORGANISM="Ochromonas sp, Strain CCMP1899" /LENGTH=456 /DNA_ID=CAMNT_0007031125 /DNA_START=962 /DNA_END=2335 /DNA_ORIENTATION=-
MDVKASLGNFLVCGIYNFGVVEVGAPKESNRRSFDMPTRGDNGRKNIANVSDAIGTSDGRHALFLCSDGAVMYLKNNSSFMDLSPRSEEGSPSELESTLTEITTLNRDPDCESAWTLRRVGRTGGVVFLRAKKIESFTDLNYADPEKFTEISVGLLSDIAPGEVTNTEYPDTRHPDYKNPYLKDPVFLKGRDLCRWNKYYDGSEVPVREPMTDDSGSIFTADTISTKLRRIGDIIESHKVLEEAYNLKIAQKSERDKVKSEKLENEDREAYNLKIAQRSERDKLKSEKLENEERGNDGNALKSVKIHNSDNLPVKKAKIIQPEREPKGHQENISSSSSVQRYALPYKEEEYANPYQEKIYLSDDEGLHPIDERDDSPMAPIRAVPTSTLALDLLDSLRKCLSHFYQNSVDNFTKDDLLNVIIEQVRPVTMEEFDEFLGLMENENILMVADDEIWLM